MLLKFYYLANGTTFLSLEEAWQYLKEHYRIDYKLLPQYFEYDDVCKDFYAKSDKEKRQQDYKEFYEIQQALLLSYLVKSCDIIVDTNETTDIYIDMERHMVDTNLDAMYTHLLADGAFLSKEQFCEEKALCPDTAVAEFLYLGYLLIENKDKWYKTIKHYRYFPNEHRIGRIYSD